MNYIAADFFSGNGNPEINILLVFSLITFVLFTACIAAVIAARLRNNRINRRMNRFVYAFEELERDSSLNKASFNPEQFELAVKNLKLFERYLKNRINNAEDAEIIKLSRIAESSGLIKEFEKTAELKSGWKRALALRSLSSLCSESDPGLYRKILAQDSFYPSVFAASLCLGRCRDTDSIDSVLERISEFKNDNREELLMIFQSFGNDICPFIVKHLIGKKATLASKTAMLDYLRLKKYYKAGNTVENILSESEEIEIKIHAVEALGVIGNRDSLGIINRHLRKECDFRIRLKALISQSLIEGVSSVSLVGTFLDDPDWWVRRNAAEILYGLDEAGITCLEKAAKQEGTQRSKAAKMILAEEKFGRKRWRYKFADSFS